MRGEQGTVEGVGKCGGNVIKELNIGNITMLQVKSIRIFLLCNEIYNFYCLTF